MPAAGARTRGERGDRLTIRCSASRVGASTDPAHTPPTLAAVGELSGSVPLGRKSTAPGLCCRGPWRVRSAPCVGLSAIIFVLSHHKVDSPPPNRAVSRGEGTCARLYEAVSAAPPPTMAACAGQDVPATRYAPTEGLVASPFQGRPVDAGSLERVVVAPRSGQRRVLTVHDSRNERTALRGAALCGAAPPRHAEEVTVELAVSADGRVAHIPRRVGDTDPCTHLSVTHKRIDPLEPIRKLFLERWTFDIHNRHDAGELHKIEGVPQ